MTISQHATTFAGLPVRPYEPGKKSRGKQPCAYRVGDTEADFPELFDRFLAEHGGEGLTALVVGAWNYESMLENSAEVVEALVAGRERMPNLRALFFGDITYEECEISWVRHGDVSALLPAFPDLEEFRIRGASNLSFGTLKHNALKSFAVESGGLPEPTLAEVLAAKLPALEHLELWLGTVGYGGITSTTPLKPLLAGKLFPKLRYLGLRNSDIADAVAAAVAKAPVLKRVRELDLSMGNLSDEGGKALLASEAVRNLERLDVHHHYLSPEVADDLGELGIAVDVSGVKEPDTYGGEVHRYNSVSE